MHEKYPSSPFYNTSATRVRHEQHVCNKNNTIATRVKNFDFDNDMNENIFSHPYINYKANERLQGEEQCYSKNYLLELPGYHAKICLKSAPQNLNGVMTKAISKSYTLEYCCKCFRTFLHSYAQ